jgi:hypothetical protein
MSKGNYLVSSRRVSFLEDLRNDLRESRPLKIVSLIVIVILIFFVIVWARALYGSRENFIRGETFLKEGQTIRAVTFFDRSIHWYTPLNPYVQKSAERLWVIGQRAEQAGDSKLALIAFSAIRSGFYGASHLVTPGKEWIKKVDAKLHDLGAGGKNVRDPHPDAFWSVVVVLGFLGWVGSVIGLILRVLGPGRGSGNPGVSVIRWAGLIVIFFILWIWGMFKA